MTKRQAVEMCPAFAAIVAQSVSLDLGDGEMNIATFVQPEHDDENNAAPIAFDGIFTTDDIIPYVAKAVKRFSPHARHIIAAKFRPGAPEVRGSDLVTLGEMTASTEIKILDFIIVGDGGAFASVMRSGMIDDIVCPHCGALDFWRMEKADNCDLVQEVNIHFEDCAHVAKVREIEEARRRGKAAV